MKAEPDAAINYKWDDYTWSGYRLSYYSETPDHPFHVEDWNQHCIVDEWDCDSLEEAVDTLNHLFVVDPETELGKLKRLFADEIKQAA